LRFYGNGRRDNKPLRTGAGSHTKTACRGIAHEGDVLNILALSRRLREAPKEIVIFGIEPYSIDPGEDLSTELEKDWAPTFLK